MLEETQIDLRDGFPLRRRKVLQVAASSLRRVSVAIASARLRASRAEIVSPMSAGEPVTRPRNA